MGTRSMVLVSKTKWRVDACNLASSQEAAPQFQDLEKNHWLYTVTTFKQQVSKQVIRDLE